MRLCGAAADSSHLRRLSYFGPTCMLRDLRALRLRTSFPHIFVFVLYLDAYVLLPLTHDALVLISATHKRLIHSYLDTYLGSSRGNHYCRSLVRLSWFAVCCRRPPNVERVGRRELLRIGTSFICLHDLRASTVRIYVVVPAAITPGMRLRACFSRLHNARILVGVFSSYVCT